MEALPKIIITSSPNKLNRELDALNTLNNIQEYNDSECSPSKNCALGPWLSAKQSLNHIYNKKVLSPQKIKQPMYRKTRILSLLVPARYAKKEQCTNPKTPLSFSKNLDISISKTLNISNNCSGLVGDALTPTIDSTKSKFNRKFPTSLRASIYSTSNSTVSRGKDLVANTIGNSKFKLILATLEPTSTHNQQLNHCNWFEQNPVLTKVTNSYQPKKLIHRRKFSKYMFKESDYLFSYKENHAPNIALVAVSDNL